MKAIAGFTLPKLDSHRVKFIILLVFIACLTALCVWDVYEGNYIWASVIGAEVLAFSYILGYHVACGKLYPIIDGYRKLCDKMQENAKIFALVADRSRKAKEWSP